MRIASSAIVRYSGNNRVFRLYGVSSMKGLSPQDKKLFVVLGLIFLCEIGLLIIGLVFGQ